MAQRPGETNEDISTPEETKKVGGVVTIVVLLVAGLAGAALPRFVPNLIAAPEADDAKAATSGISPIINGMTYIPFGEVTVNLDEGRMNRYLRIKMSLQVRESEQEQIEKLVEQKQLVLKNWLLSHLSDKTLDEIRGRAGQNQLRRELRTYFNSALFTNGKEAVYDILFEEFNVQ